MPEPEEIEDDEEETTRRRMDPELLVMQQMMRLLEKIAPEGRKDVVDYMTRRFNRSAPKET